MAAAGVSVPSLENRPELTEFTHQYFSGFMHLIDSRNVGMGGVSSIFFSEILDYVDRFVGVEDADDRETWVRMIRALDAEYIRIMNERAKRESGSGVRR